MNKIRFSFLLLSAFLLISCNKNKSREKPDVSNIDVKVQIQRFDQDLFELNAQDGFQGQGKLLSKYGSFFPFYLNQFVLGEPQTAANTDVRQQMLERFLSDTYIRKLQDSINLHYANMDDIETELSQSFKYFKYYYPEFVPPNVITINSGFSLGAFTYDKDVLGIGLDLYLGSNNPDYDSAGIFQYVQHKMHRGFIVRNALEVLVNFHFENDENLRDNNLIEAMVERGKKLYFLSYLLPEAPDSLLLGFTQPQIDWCQNSEYEIWKFLNDKDLLYKNDFMEKKRYLDEGPTTTGMPADSPGNLGSWIGLQIVRKFMQEIGKKITPRDLMVKYDAKTILSKSKYRPSKSVF